MHFVDGWMDMGGCGWMRVKDADSYEWMGMDDGGWGWSGMHVDWRG